uniref:Uncharacterized protein n=1 Tax=Arion vulgaris TaxID=1028688 RepID=A0A0B6Y4J0_9EUPU
MDQSDVSRNDLERLAVKCLYAADILQNSVNSAENLQKIQKKVSRYVQQVKLILTWKRGCGVFKMVGSASKVVGNVIVVAAPLHPKLGLAVRAGHKLWKFGAGLKALTAIGHMLKDLWQIGCRNSIVDFINATALLTRNLGVFSEVIQDIQSCAQSVSGSNNTNQTPETVINILRPFIPPHQIDYITHVVNFAFGSRYYSPLFDLILSSDVSSSSHIVQLMREMESFNFIEFIEQGNNRSLIAIGSFLHISRELLDFLDGFQKVTDHDCRFLLDCLTRFTQESTNIMKTVSVLTNLNQLRRQQVA